MLNVPIRLSPHVTKECPTSVEKNRDFYRQNRSESQLKSPIKSLHRELIFTFKLSFILLVPRENTTRVMGFVIAKAILTLLLSMLCFTVFSEKVEPADQPLHHGSHHHYPTAAPVSEPPSHAPSLAPAPHLHHHHHHHGHSPAPAPVNTPAHAPVHPPKPHSPPSVPAHPPMHPHPHPHPHPRSYHFPRKLVAVQGVVYCKSCNYSGVDTFLGAKPVPGNLFTLSKPSCLTFSAISS
jgi:hypothetical protein